MPDLDLRLDLREEHVPHICPAEGLVVNVGVVVIETFVDLALTVSTTFEQWLAFELTSQIAPVGSLSHLDSMLAALVEPVSVMLADVISLVK